MVGPIKKFDILFSNPNGAFYAGKAVTGKVIVEITESIKIRAVKLRFVGEASVSFSDGKLKKSHSDSHRYFEQLDLIFGSDNGGVLKSDPTTVLNTGTHEFPFVFNLPGQVPSSFESTLGHVRYFCKATLHRPWKFDFTAKRAFTVVANVDLNHEPAAFTPAYRHAERSFSWTDWLFFCAKGGLTITVKIDRSAFVPGEDILINAEVSNYSSNKVKDVEAFLQQNLVFSTKTATRFCRGETKLGLVNRGCVNKNDTQIWNNHPLPIPALPPSKLGGCRMISVDYVLNFIVYIENAPNVVMNIPIVLGTVPLYSPAPPPVQWPNAAGVQPSAPLYEPSLPRPHPTAPPMPDFELLAPPSYEECVGMDQVNIQDSEDDQMTYGELNYRPLYPTYSRERPARPPPPVL